MFDAMIVAFYVAAVAAIVLVARRFAGTGTGTGSERGTGRGAVAWAFAGFAVIIILTVMVVAREGLMQFWVNHRANWAGVQVWFDLLAAVAIAFYLIAPRARAVGMLLVPWGIAVAMTATIALLPMLARLLMLEARGRDGLGVPARQAG